MISPQQEAIIKKCQHSVTWFLRNFGKLKHPSAGVIDFHPFSYQKDAIRQFRTHRLNIFRKCRQSGISKISGAFAAWFAMFHPHKTILIVSRTNEDAMSFLREHIVFLYEHLPAWMMEVWKPVKMNEHEIIFPNGSRIKSMTSHPDVLRSNASSLNIIDESAFIQGMDVMWAGGWPCRVGDTLIQTDEGLQKIESFNKTSEEWQDLGVKVATDEGYKTADKLHIPNDGKIAPTIKITTKLGFIEEGTPHHRFRTIDEFGDYVWKQMGDFKPGDIVCSLPGQFEGKRQHLSDGNIDLELTPQLAELIGLYVGDGTIYDSRPKRFKIHFDPQDYKTKNYAIDSLNNILNSINNPTQSYSENGNCTVNLRLNSAPFIDFLCAAGLKSKTCPQDAEIPAPVLKSDRKVVCAFLRGLFDSDGWCYQSSTSLKLGFSTQSAQLASQTQVLLHSLGILSKIVRPKVGKGRFGKERSYRLDILDCNAKTLFKEIGFITHRKQQFLDNHTSTFAKSIISHSFLIHGFLDEIHDRILDLRKSDKRTKLLACFYDWRKKHRVSLSAVEELTEFFGLNCKLSNLVKKGLFFDKVKKLDKSKARVFDISVPENNTYLANGIVNHNTLQHGGNVICISTTNGLGNWYWSTWTDAEAGVNGWNPININWWDMDWVIKYRDPLSRTNKRIAPRDELRKCVDQKERDRFGPYWSPWLQEQYDALQEQGGDWKFKQEILADFIGSGNTVLPPAVLNHVSTTIKNPEKIITGYQAYVHPVSGNVEDLNFTFGEPDEGLWIWEEPVIATVNKLRGNILVEQGQSAHSYVMGCDIATGKGKDYSAIEVFDVDTMEQVAEFMARCLPQEFVKFMDRIGRWYNCALAVIERNNGGDILIDLMRTNMMYPRIWRKATLNDKPRPPGSSHKARAMQVAPYGFSTSMASKPTLNKYLLDFIRDAEGDGYAIYSKRLHKQLQTYVRKRDRMGRDTNKTEAEEGVGNYDDLVIACALGLVGTGDAGVSDASNLIPFGGGENFTSMSGPVVLSDNQRIVAQREFIEQGGPSLMMPMALSPDESPDISAQQQLAAYTIQLGGIPMGDGKPTVVPPKFYYERKNK